MSRGRVSLALAMVLLGAIGCAQVKHQPVADFNAPKGVPYYLGSWYLLTYPDGRGGLASQYFFLRDPNKRMEARPCAWLASLSTALTFEGGVLTNSDSTADSSALPAALIEGAETFLKALAAANDAAQIARPGLLAPSIYKVKFVNATTLEFIGDQTSYTVSVAGWRQEG